jgi:hypothetical protein
MVIEESAFDPACEDAPDSRLRLSRLIAITNNPSIINGKIQKR